MKALILILNLLAAHTVSADCICELADRLNGGAYLHEELTIVTHIDDSDESLTIPHGSAPPADRGRVIDQLALAGFRLHGFIGKHRTFGLHIGIDLAAGATTGRHGGFAYEAGLLPLGLGVRLGRSSFLTLGTGVVASGATGALDDAIALPFDVDLELDARRVRLIVWGRASWLAGASGRSGGSPSVPLVDQIEAMIGIRIGHHYEEWGFPTGNGAYLGVAYKELAGIKFLGITFGYSLDMATAPHPTLPLAK